MKWILCLIALSSCGGEPSVRLGAPDLRPALIASSSRCRVGSAFVQPDVGQKRCDEYRCDSGWIRNGTVVWERRERFTFGCRKTSPVPQNAASTLN